MRETLGDAEFSSYMQVGGRGHAGVRVMKCWVQTQRCMPSVRLVHTEEHSLP